MVGGMNDLCELINIWNFRNNYDDYDFREGGGHLGFGAGLEKLYFWRSIHIHINHSKLLII